jgi:myo-inositol-1(or 4)-monophosphatase
VDVQENKALQAMLSEEDYLRVTRTKAWMREVRELLLNKMNENFSVETKTSRTDIVTELDKFVQNELIARIHGSYPDDLILAEENGLNTTEIDNGKVWVIDPIDGTLNFYLQRDNFAMMVAYFEGGVGKFGFIFDVMTDNLYYGGSGIGVYRNEEKMEVPQNSPLSEGLLGVNAYMFAENIGHTRDIARVTMGVRVDGSAGIEMVNLLEGKNIGYISSLYPWDYASGVILAHEFGMKASALDFTPLPYKDKTKFLIATGNAYDDIINLVKH